MIETFSKELSVPAYLFFIESTEVKINKDFITKKRNEEFSQKLLKNITNLLKDYEFLE